MARLGLVAVGRRGRRPFAAPAAFLLAVTLAVVVIHSARHHASPTTPKSLVIQTKVPVALLPRLYRVTAGDTMVGISAKTRVPLPRLRTLNPSLQPTALFIGEKIRLR